ncbi:WhiB family transcriptional regulator [Nocardia thailandica]|uniref:WhiB family transcriptional regulator n=1 Tax=Nocardia thailandica TaxID=257275 RepID=UPI0003046415|nr:WhiB family transcriptional regulator [Nocardia thailandica]
MNAEDWTTVACRSNPELWFSKQIHDKARAKRYCGDCPLRRACAEAIVPKTRYGIFAGFDLESPAERRGLDAWLNGVEPVIPPPPALAHCEVCGQEFRPGAQRSPKKCMPCSSGFVDARPLWPLLDMLINAGWSRSRIAREADVSANSVIGLCKKDDRQRWASPQTFAAIEAVFESAVESAVAKAVA